MLRNIIKMYMILASLVLVQGLIKMTVAVDPIKINLIAKIKVIKAMP